MGIDFFTPQDWATWLRRYAIISALRFGWLYAFILTLAYPVANAFYPKPLLAADIIEFFSVDPLFFSSSARAAFTVDIILALVQVGLLIGAVRLLARRLRPAMPSGHDIDGRRLVRPWWMTPAAMTGSLIVSCYLVVWLVLAGTARPNVPVPLGRVFYEAGWGPLYVGLFLGCLGFLFGHRFNQSVRESLSDAAGVKMLADDHPLTQRVHALASRLDLPPPAVGYTRAFNAFAMGSNPSNAAVVIGYPLIKTLSLPELDAVIGHELGHIATGDMRRMQYAEGFQRMFGVLVAAMSTIGIAMASKHSRSGAGFARLFGGAARYTVALGSEFIVKGLSRSREYYADAIGAALTSPEAMRGALEKVNAHGERGTPAEDQYAYLMFRRPGKGLNLFSTHPTFESRCTALKKRTHLSALPYRGKSG